MCNWPLEQSLKINIENKATYCHALQYIGYFDFWGGYAYCCRERCRGESRETIFSTWRSIGWQQLPPSIHEETTSLWIRQKSVFEDMFACWHCSRNMLSSDSLVVNALIKYISARRCVLVFRNSSITNNTSSCNKIWGKSTWRNKIKTVRTEQIWKIYRPLSTSF